MSREPAGSQDVRERATLKRLLARLCNCDEHDFVRRMVEPSLVGMIGGEDTRRGSAIPRRVHRRRHHPRRHLPLAGIPHPQRQPRADRREHRGGGRAA